MKYEVTEKGVNGPEGRIEKGDTVEVEGDLPGYLVGKCRPVGGKTAVTNPAKDAVQQSMAEPSAQERQQILGEISVNDLAGDDFNDEGVPDVRKVNENLPEGAKKFSAGERDQLWPGIAEAVKAGREAVDSTDA